MVGEQRLTLLAQLICLLAIQTPRSLKMTDLISGVMADLSRAHGREKATKPGEPKKGKDTKNGASPRGSSTRGEKLRDPIPTKSVVADEGSVGTGPRSTTRQGKPAHNMAAAGGSDETTALGALMNYFIDFNHRYIVFLQTLAL